jgi:hypothetical protein
MGVGDITTPAAITAGATVASINTATHTVTLSNNVPVGQTVATSNQILFGSPAGSTVLYFPSSPGVPATVKAGMGVADSTNPSVILAQTKVTATTATTVTISNATGGITGFGVQPSDQIVFSPTGNCTSQDNPSPTDLVQIFAAIGNSLQYTTLLSQP